MNLIRLLCVITFVVIIGQSSSASTPKRLSGPMTIDGDVFERAVTVNRTYLELKGTALLRYLVFIKVYTGALYLPATAVSSDALSDIPKYLVLEYRVAISGADFATATSQCIKQATTEVEYAGLKNRIELLNSWFRDVAPGDRYSISYIPGSGTTLELNNTVLGTLPGQDFARALFAVWLGDKPIDKTFRDTLLGANP